MTEETARLLIEAANRLALAIERAAGGLGSSRGGGIQRPYQQPSYSKWLVPTCGGWSR